MYGVQRLRKAGEPSRRFAARGGARKGQAGMTSRVELSLRIALRGWPGEDGPVKTLAWQRGGVTPVPSQL
jgi:hypothetical protein